MSSDAKKDESNAGSTFVIDRRLFLQAFGTAISVAALPEALSSCGISTESVSVNEESLVVDGGQYSVVRPADLLVLTFSLINLKQDATNKLVKILPAGDAYLMVDFPSQAIFEQAFAPTIPAKTATQFALSRIGGRSRLVFRLPPTFTSDLFTVERLLALCSASDLVIPSDVSGLSPSVLPTSIPDPSLGPLLEATVAASLAPSDPDAAGRLTILRGLPLPPHVSSGSSTAPFADRTVSYVEMPFRLMLAPNGYAAWAHVTKPLVSAVSGRTELWHTVLGVRGQDAKSVDEKNVYYRTARAVHARDKDVTATPADWVTTLSYFPSLLPGDRATIVRNTSVGTGPLDTAPLQIDRMMLSALGGYLDLKGDFSGITDNHGLREWSHRMSGGRESFVEKIQDGLLAPFQFSASLTTITVRSDTPQNAPVGQTYQFGVVTIRNPVVRFPQAGGPYSQSRRFPFLAAEAKTTRFVVASQTSSGIALDLSGNPIWMPVAAYDCRGRKIEFSVPLIFVLGASPTLDDFNTAYCNGVKVAQPSADPGTLDLALNGQRVAYAASRSDDTTFATRSAKLALEVPVNAGPVAALVLKTMTLDIEALHALGDDAPRTFTYHDAFAASGLPATPAEANTLGNKSQYLLKYAPDSGEPTIALSFTNRADGGTGFVSPNMTFNAISTATGPANDGSGSNGIHARQFAPMTPPEDGAFDPSSFFNLGQLAESELEKLKILGVFAIDEIIQAIRPDQILADLGELSSDIVDNALRFAPKFVADGYHALESFIGALVSLRTQLETLFLHAKELETKAQTSVAKVAADVAALKSAITAVYKDLTGALAAIENRDVALLTGNDWQGFPALAGRQAILPTLRVHITALRAALDTLATDGNAAASALGSPPAVVVVAGIRLAVDKRLDAVGAVIGTLAKEDAKGAAIVAMVTAVEQAIESARDLTLKLDWQPKIGTVSLGGAAAFVPSSAHGLTLAFEVRPKAQGTAPAGMDVSCRLDAFRCHLGGTDDDALLTLKLNRLAFTKAAGKKADVDVVFDGIVFGGALSFLEALRKIIPLDGFSDPPFLDVTVDGIRAGFALAVPNVAVGMFSLENIKVSAELVVPFFTDSAITKVLTFTFKFSERDDPFLVTVSMLGGGGYFILSVTPAGLQQIEASINVAAQVAINLGVAAGCVSISLGIILTYNAGSVDANGVDQGLSLTGYLRLHGELDVLGIVSISVDLRVSITYEFATRTVIAKASVHVEVHILFFSFSKDLPFERRFSACNGDPTLRDLLGSNALPGTANDFSQSWLDYCAVYA